MKKIEVRFKLLLVTLAIWLLPSARMFFPPASELNFWIIDAFLMFVVPAAYLTVLVRSGVHVSDIGLSNPLFQYPAARLFRITLLCTFIYFASTFVNAIAALVLPAHTFAVDQFSQDVAGNSEATGLPAVLYQAAAAAFFEEVLRGVLAYTILVDDTRASRVAYVLLSCSITTVIHLSSPDPLVITTAVYTGVVSALLFIRYRTVCPLLVAHFSLDAFAIWWLSSST